MSLASLAVRIATIRAVKGRTFAGANVFDSKIAPIDLIVADGGGKDFVIVVTTDDDAIGIEGRDLLAGDHKLELVIEIAAAAKLTVTEPAGEDEPEEVVTILPSDAGLEATLNLIGWQITRELVAEGGAWGDRWRRLVLRVHDITSRRGADETNGVRYAARQMVYRVDHIAEPMPGTPLQGTWAEMIAAIKADSDYAAVGRIAEATILGGELEVWERARASLGLADDASGHFTNWPFTPDLVAPLAEIETTDGFLLDDDVADTADGPDAEDD